MVCVAGITVFLSVTQRHYPVSKWLFWIYARAWLFAGIWAAGCLSTGHALLTRLLKRTLPLQEHGVMAFAVGLLASYLLIFLAGICHLFGPVFFYALPALMVALGAPACWRTARRLRKHSSRARRTPGAKPWYYLPAVGFGVLACALAYFMILSPHNVAYDARWYHLANAERFAGVGGIDRFNEGWYLGIYPQLASYLYTWGFLAPGSGLFERVIQCAHLEFVVFLFTLASVPALVRRLVPGVRAVGSWSAVFLFPALFVYDSNLNGSADHIAAFWAGPIFLALLAVWREWNVRHAALLAALIAGAMSVKFTAIILALFPMAAFVLRALLLLFRRGGDRRAVLRGVLVALLVGIGLTAPYWAKNLIFYGNPVYPMAHTLFPSRPWTPDSYVPFAHYFLTDWSRPDRDWTGVVQSGQALFTHSFIPNNWPEMYGSWPVFGSLFTLMLGLLPFLRKTKRIWALYAAVHLGILAWYWIHHFDRYLQVFVPWMAAAVVAIIALAWRLGWVARAGVLLLLMVQVVWSLDTPFIPSHSMIPQRSSLSASLELLSQGYKKKYSERLAFQGPFAQVGKQLPRDAKVLVHDMHVFFGIGRPVVSDFAGTQGGISYFRSATPAALHDLLASFGVSHVLWSKEKTSAHDTLASDIVFHDYAKRFLKRTKNIGGFAVAELGKRPNAKEQFGRVVMATCRGPYAGGVYELSDLGDSPWDPSQPWLKKQPLAPLSPDLFQQASYAVEDGSCGKSTYTAELASFQLLVDRGGYRLYGRKR